MKRRYNRVSVVEVADITRQEGIYSANRANGEERKEREAYERDVMRKYGYGVYCPKWRRSVHRAVIRYKRTCA